MRISEMVKLQTYQNKFGFGKSDSSSSISDAEQARIDKGQEEFRQHMADLEASGYLIKDNSHKVIVPISDEVKAKVLEYVRNQYVNNAGWSLEGDESLGDISFSYTETLKPAERLSASWSVNQYYFDISAQYKAKIQETNPNFPYDGSSYDPSIFDDFAPHEAIDIKA